MLDNNEILKEEFERQIFYKQEEITRNERMIGIYEKDIADKQHDIGNWKEQIRQTNIIIEGLKRLKNEL